VARLKSGVSIQIESIALNPSNGRAGWRADGSMLPRALYARLSGQTEVADEERRREVAVRVSRAAGADGAPVSVRWSIRGTSGFGGGAPKDERGRTVPGVEVVVFPVPAKLGDAVTLHADVAAGEWRTRFSAGLGGATVTDEQRTFQFGPVYDLADGKTVVTFVRTLGAGDENDAMRVVVVDRAGQVRNAQIRQLTTAGKLATAEYNVPVARKDLEEMQFQTRPYDQWLEIRNVCVDPAKPTKVETASSDGKE
jgi:hypothetical protein